MALPPGAGPSESTWRLGVQVQSLEVKKVRVVHLDHFSRRRRLCYLRGVWGEALGFIIMIDYSPLII